MADPSKVRLQHLLAFDRTYKTRNMAEAARQMSVGDAVVRRGDVWRHVSALGRELFGDERSLFTEAPSGSRGRRSEPTADAHRIAPVVSQMIEEYEKLVVAATGAKPPLRVACYPAAVSTIVADVVALHDHAVLRDVDDVHRLDGGAGLMALLDDHQVDVVVVPTESPSHSSIPLYRWRLGIYFKARERRFDLPTVVARARTDSFVAASALDGVPLLVSPERHSSRLLVKRIFESAEVTPDIRLASASTESLMAYVDAGLGVAVLPSDSVWRHRGRRRVFLDDESATGHHHLCWRRGEHESDSRLEEFVSVAKRLRDEQVRLDKVPR